LKKSQSSKYGPGLPTGRFDCQISQNWQIYNCLAVKISNWQKTGRKLADFENSYKNCHFSRFLDHISKKFLCQRQILFRKGPFLRPAPKSLSGSRGQAGAVKFFCAFGAGTDMYINFVGRR